MKKIRDFLKRHSFILIMIIAALVALTNYLVYPTFIKKELKLVEVPVAIVQLEPATLITDEKITTISIDKSFLPANIITEKDEIIGKYASENSIIPANGFFYKDLLADEVSQFGDTFHQLEDGTYAYAIEIDPVYNVNGVIKKGQYISVFFDGEYENENGVKAFMVGQLAENRKVLDVAENYISIQIDENEIGYFILAQKVGEISPYLSDKGNGVNMVNTSFYSIDGLRGYLQEQNTLFFEEQNIEEEINEEPVYIPPVVQSTDEANGVVE